MKKLLKVMLALVLVLPVGCSNNTKEKSSSSTETAAGYTAGTYTGTADGYGGTVTVTITVSDTEITDVTVEGPDETPTVGGAAVDELAEQIKDAQSYEIDGVSGATYTSTAAKEAAKAALEEAGAKIEETVTEKGEDVELTTDVLVIGLGASGTMAALSAAENGAKVVGVEATGTIGGMGNAAQGMFAIGTDEQIERYGEELATDNEYWYNKIVAETRMMGNEALISEDVNESANTVQYLQDHGVAMYLSKTAQMIGHFDDIVEYHRWNNCEPFKYLTASMEENGVDIHMNTIAQSLLTDDNGNVTGAVCTQEDGSTLTVHATSTIVATGSFAGDETLMREVLTDAVYENCFVIPAANNPGLSMMWDVGAEKGNLLPMCHGVTSNDTLEVADELTLNTPILWINQRGERFMSASALKETTNFTTAVVSQGGVAYTLVDEATVQRWCDSSYENTGTWIHYWDQNGIIDENGEYTTYHAIVDYDTFQKDFETLSASGEGGKFDTLDEVAEYLGCDVADLMDSVNSWNTAVETGKDTEFYTDSEDLVYSVKEGPYYVTKGHAGVLVALGGVNVTTDLEVLDSNYKVIPGLYATGNNCSGVSDFVYSTIEGIGLGFALTSGRLGGAAAAEYALAD